TYGHNEAVVNGLLPVDSYYVNDYSSIYPLIKTKKNRLKANLNRETKKYRLEYQTNDSKQENSSTLSTEEILELTNFAKKLELMYGYPVDIEFVIQNNKIQIVQCRPLEQQAKNPSFIKQSFYDSLDKNIIFNAEMIGVGDAQTVIIDSEDQLIFDSTLKKAVDNQFLPSPSQNLIKGILVLQSAPSTSHEATIARSNSLPVFVIQDIDKIKAALHQNKKVVLDPQRGIVVVSELDTIEKNIGRGWFNHPIPPLLSLWHEKPIDVGIPQDIADRIKPFCETISSELLNIIKHDVDFSRARNATYAFLYQCTQTIYTTLQKPNIDKDVQKQLTTLQCELQKTIRDQLNILDRIEDKLILNENARLARLFPASRLEALFKQVPSQQTINTFSLGSLLKTNKEEETIAINLNLHKFPSQELAPFTIQYAKAAEYLLSDELQGAWKHFITEFSQKSEEENEAFAQMIQALASLDALPLWINTSFTQAIEQPDANVNSVYKYLTDEFNQSKNFIGQLKEYSDFFVQFPYQSFENPDIFEKQWKLFSDQLNATVNNKEFITSLDQATPLGKLVSTTCLKKAIDAFDNSIKALTGSTMYKKDALHAERFKQMVTQYLNWFETLCTMPSLQDDLDNLCSDDINPWIYDASKKKFVNANKYKSYIQGIHKLLLLTPKNTMESKDNFIPYLEFNVAGAALGSKASFSRSIGYNHSFFNDKNNIKYPTLENIFSLVHQNLLTVNNLILKKENITSIKLPQTIQKLKQTIEEKIQYQSQYKKTINIKLANINFEKNIIIFQYNLPLGAHSAIFELKYDRFKKRTFLAISFLGKDWDRWENIGHSAQLLSKLYDIPLMNPVTLSDYEVKFEFEVTDEEKLNIIIPFINNCSLYSFAANSPGISLEKVLDEVTGNKVSVVLKLLQEKKSHLKQNLNREYSSI
ncbi:hypothetical protein JKY79_02375, partial [Candidatus Babeliales bacterium]|nr:hypothetical protein [Candidatus Babeliales bacterium]